MHALGHDGHDGGLGHDGDMTSDILNIRNLIIFGVGFGAAGFIAQRLGQNPFVSSFWGLGFGVVMIVAAATFYHNIRKQESNSLADHGTLVGKRASVTTTIPESGYGEVSTANAFGAAVNLTAQSQDGAHMAGSIVEIVTVVGNTATVKAYA
jgi:membrane protein implicated in regulation of membrane protease activity